MSDVYYYYYYLCAVSVDVFEMIFNRPDRICCQISRLSWYQRSTAPTRTTRTTTEELRTRDIVVYTANGTCTVPTEEGPWEQGKSLRRKLCWGSISQAILNSPVERSSVELRPGYFYHTTDTQKGSDPPQETNIGTTQPEISRILSSKWGLHEIAPQGWFRPGTKIVLSYIRAMYDTRLRIGER